MYSLNQIKKIIENNPIAFATITIDNKPNVVGVASVKVISDSQILITDNYMNQTIKDISKNINVCLIVWDSKMCGYKLIGKAKYFIDGKWKKYVKEMKENKGLPAKGAILIKISNIITSK